MRRFAATHLPAPSVRNAALLVLALVLVWINVGGLVQTFSALPNWGSAGDWYYLSQLDPADPYAVEAFRWAPPAAWLWQLVVADGFWTWAALHVVAVGLIRPYWVGAIVLASWPFWADLANGNVLTFVLVAAWAALAGSRSATVAYVLLAVLMPRPLMLPALAWLLWHRSDARWTLILGGAGVLIASLAMGQFDDWLVRLIRSGAEETVSPYNIGPSAWLGVAWVPIGLALAAWLTWKGRLGLASLAISPYWLIYYPLMAVLEFGRSRLRPARPSWHGRAR